MVSLGEVGPGGRGGGWYGKVPEAHITTPQCGCECVDRLNLLILVA